MTYKDTDLREALRRRYAETPPMPPGLGERVAQRIAQQEKKPRIRYRKYAAIAIAASISLLAVFHFSKETVKEKPTAGGYPIAQAGDMKVISAKNVIETESAKPVMIKTVSRKATRGRQESGRSKANTTANIPATDSLDYYISRVEQQLNEVRESCYAANVEKLIRADEHLSRIVNRLLLDGLLTDSLPHTALYE